MLERNYLDVYIYDKWEGRRVPEFREDETFVPRYEPSCTASGWYSCNVYGSVCELKEGQTTCPKYLTEADLVGLMDKNGIGVNTSSMPPFQT